MFFFVSSYAQSVGAIYFEASAKNNIGVEDVFLNLTNMVRRRIMIFFANLCLQFFSYFIR